MKVLFFMLWNTFPAGIYLLKVNTRKTRTWWEIWSKLTIKTPEQCQWRCSGVFIVNFVHFTHCSSVSIVNFGHVIACTCHCTCAHQGFRDVHFSENVVYILNEWYLIWLFLDPKKIFALILSYLLPHMVDHSRHEVQVTKVVSLWKVFRIW